MFIDCVYKALRTPKEIQKTLEILTEADMLSGDSSVIQLYEKNLSYYFNTKHAIAVSSGTAALHASLLTVIEPGDEVLVPAICVPMTVSAILQAGGIPVFYDSSINSFKPCLKDFNDKITAKTRVLITVSMWGYRAIDSDIVGTCRQKNITIIEDAAQSTGTDSLLGYEGTIGDIGCFSTHEFKLISTGEGGFILTNSDEYAEKIRSFTHIGFSQHHGSFGYTDGLNYKLSAFQAAVGIAQLASLDIKIQGREKRKAKWKILLQQSKYIDFLNSDVMSRHNCYSLVCLLNENVKYTGKELANKLYTLGINTDTYRYKNAIVSNYPYCKVFYTQPKYSGNNNIDFPNASNLVRRMLVLPCHERVSIEAIHKASQNIINLLDGA
ncbi:aminotransferase class I/II-fold pyridoxal phosphate-dependent enzyme [uncultured Cedecea sp.]|uniref:DegT/DnrJ/EryC1/StrS family aminotransferase n=1 Tax=uncultured Cedecea sp. TaxID=988762 RepID=UPI002610F9CA|nr:aminotransferase class I/II-fold pyridoxal phosphate-dependent enzyme [uncultured Cedecea sp.]